MANNIIIFDTDGNYEIFNSEEQKAIFKQLGDTYEFQWNDRYMRHLLESPHSLSSDSGFSLSDGSWVVFYAGDNGKIENPMGTVFAHQEFCCNIFCWRRWLGIRCYHLENEKNEKNEKNPIYGKIGFKKFRDGHPSKITQKDIEDILEKYLDRLLT